jgi:DNA-binding response OmpR family regulator
MSSPPFHIVILDDNASDASALMQALKRVRSEVPVYMLFDSRILPAYFSRNSPIAALRGPLQPGLLILQSTMLHYSGFETLTWIRSERRLDCMLVVVLGPSDDSAERARFLAAGADAFLARPPSADSPYRLAREIFSFCAARAPVDLAARGGAAAPGRLRETEVLQ